MFLDVTDLLNRAVVIESRSASGDLDEGGAEIPTETAVQTVCEIQPRRTDEPTQHPDIADSDWIGWFLVADAAYLRSASLIWVPEMGEFKVVGDSPTWRDPFDQDEKFVEVDLNRVAGPGDSEGS